MCIILVVAVFFVVKSRSTDENPVPVVSDGYFMEVFARDLDDPRVIAFDAKGRMLISETDAGRVTIVSPERRILLEGLDNPHGLAFYTDKKNTTYLYIATVREVARYVYNSETGTIDISTKKNIMNFPAGGDRVVRTIGFGKDFRDAPLVKGLPRGSFLSAIKLYASIGSSCDACLENTWKYAAILEADWDGTYTAEVAGGLRDVEFFTFHPTTGALWATEQSRKGFSDEINIIKPTLKYGWPYCYGAQKRDESFTQKTDRTDLPMDCTKTELPVAELPSDMDPRGIAFLSPTELLVATRKKIIKITFDAKGQLVRFDDFITSIQATDLKLENGILYISDDNAGIIYKVSPIS